MIREDQFRISRRPYAVHLDGGLHVNGSHVDLDAVWFRRRNGVTVACIGHLWDIQDPCPADGHEFLRRANDGRYGGTCLGRWDGQHYWGEQDIEVMQQHLEILRPMLDNYPAVPPGFDGWWRYERREEVTGRSHVDQSRS